MLGSTDVMSSFTVHDTLPVLAVACRGQHVKACDVHDGAIAPSSMIAAVPPVGHAAAPIQAQHAPVRRDHAAGVGTVLPSGAAAAGHVTVQQGRDRVLATGLCSVCID